MFLMKYLYSFEADLFEMVLHIKKTIVYLKRKRKLKVKRHRLTNISVKAFFYVPARFTVLKIEPSDPRSNIVMVLLK